MKILVDMNLAVRWADMLSRRGVEAVYWSSVDAANAPDTEIMAWARDRGYTVLTNDLDFGAVLAATRRDKPSVIQIRAADTRPEGLIELVVKVLSQASAEIEKGALVTIDTRKARLHILPITPKKA
jgi:predicted nuclease of predicted toxin-antitoxin system